MSKQSGVHDPKIEDEAAEWVIRQDSSLMTNADEQQFNAWLAQSDAHASAYNDMLVAWYELDNIGSRIPEARPHDALSNTIRFPQTSRKETVCQTRPITPGRFWNPRPIAAAAALLAIISIGWFMAGTPDNNNILTTDVGEIRKEVLADGSTVSLNTDTKLVVDYSETARRIILKNGEVYFTVAHDAARPFVVFTDKGVIRAVGTEFDIFNRNDSVVVTITEGIVDYIHPSEELRHATDIANIAEIAPSPTKRLTAGQRLDFNGPTPAVIDASEDEIERIHAWNQNMLSFSGETLQEVVKTLNYHTNRHIIVADKRLNNRLIGGRFNAKDINGIISSLELILPVKVVRVTPYLILLTYNEKT